MIALETEMEVYLQSLRLYNEVACINDRLIGVQLLSKTVTPQIKGWPLGGFYLTMDVDLSASTGI